MPAVEASARPVSLNALLLTVFFLLAVLAAGWLTTPCLGDEISFYRLAKGFYQDHKRTVIDPVYAASGLIYYYNSEVLWPAGLSAIWTLMGRTSAAGAQVYHSLYFLLLLISTYCLSRRWLLAEQAGASIFVLATAPMVAAFSILFYAEIPMMALAVAAIALFTGGRILAAGTFMAMACLTKLTAVFFLPALAMLIFFQKLSLNKKVLTFFLFFAPVIVAVLADAWWRKTHLNMAYLFSYDPETVTSPSAWQTLKDRLFLKDAIQRFKELKESGIWEYTSSSFLNIKDVLKYFGPILLALPAFLLSKKIRMETLTPGGKEAVRTCALLIVSYSLCFLYMFIFSPDIRGLLPIAPFLAILAGAAAVKLKKKALILVAALCLTQFAASIFFVVAERRIPTDIQEGFEFIKKTVPHEELILYPEYVLVEQTERGMIWSHRFRAQMARLFWDTNKQQILDYLLAHKVRYIAVKKGRVYDDKLQRHFGGYPQSFVDSMPDEPRFKLLFDNNAMSVWSIQP